MTEENSSNEELKWILASLKDSDIKDYTIDMPKPLKKGEGYATKTLFVTVNGTKVSTGKKVKLDLVFKISSEVFVQNGLGEYYKKEMLVYDKIFPAFNSFSKGTRTNEVFDHIPRCFKTFSMDGKDIVVLENLRTLGYEPHDRLLPMNVDHIKSVLKRYAQFHAISFAYRDQMPDEFKNLVGNYSNGHKVLSASAYRNTFHTKISKIRHIIENVDEDLVKKVDDIIEKSVVDLLDERLDEVVEESVITHGDCWNCNFLFKYKDKQKTCPTQVVILDWQLSCLHSPTLDLGYFLFTNSSKEEVSQFDDLLRYYYQELSTAIKDLGSDPEKLIPFSKFYEHWKKFCYLGMLYNLCFLDQFMCEPEDVVEFENYENAEELIEAATNLPANVDLYLERLLACTRYYFDLIER